jgi:DNA-binding SARP family transcriptional activator
MKQSVVDGRMENAGKLATDLLRQAENCAKAGLLEQAQALMAKVWVATKASDRDLANAAAWEAAWLLMRLQIYDEAAVWFERVTAPPTRQSPLWLTAVQAQIKLCRKLAGNPAPPRQWLLLSTATPAAPAHNAGATQLPVLAIANLGRFQMTRAGIVLPACRARKAIAIFRYLLTRHHHSAHKEELMELLWPDVRPREAAHSLHVAVSALRRYLDPDTGTYLLFQEGRYRLNPEAPIEDDCAAFQQLGDRADNARRAGNLPEALHAYTDAIAYYQGEFYVDDCDLSWALTERERLLARYLSNLDQLGHILIGQGRFDLAIDYYQCLLERDGYREDVHCQLMRCYWRLGRRGDALRQYRRCATILLNDLGLKPMLETHELYQIIIRADPADSESQR